jgi:hypothetical protein
MNFITQIYTNSKATILTKLKKNPNTKSRVHCFTVILTIFPVKLVDSTQALEEQITQHNETVFTKSRAITLQMLDNPQGKLKEHIYTC